MSEIMYIQFQQGYKVFSFRRQCNNRGLQACRYTKHGQMIQRALYLSCE
jgi:hypothetical protein